MQHLIKNGQSVENDPWTLFDAEADSALPEFALLPSSFWETQGTELRDTRLELGLFLRAGDTLEGVLPYLDQLAVIAFEFEKFADGRAFSLARQLRSEHRYQGEIRAFGDILPDQINYLRRSGFDAFAMRTPQEAQTALSLSEPFTVQYQSDAVEQKPLFRRRTA